jgi:hypothetical protein
MFSQLGELGVNLRVCAETASAGRAWGAKRVAREGEPSRQQCFDFTPRSRGDTRYGWALAWHNPAIILQSIRDVNRLNEKN